MGNCELLFHDLHILDNPNAVMTWPDGSTTNPLDTAYKVLTVKGRLDCLVHPSMRGLQHWKYETFGRRVMLMEVGLYVLWLALFSTASLLLPVVHPGTCTAESPCAHMSNYSGDTGLVRGVFEICTLILQASLCALDLTDAMGTARSVTVFPTMSKVLTLALTLGRGDSTKKRVVLVPTLHSILHLLPHAAVAVAVCQRHSREVEVDKVVCEMHVSLIVSANFLGWVRLTEYLMLHRHMGPFFIMVSEMIVSDFVKFAIIPSVFLPGFAVGFVLLFRFPPSLPDSFEASAGNETASVMATAAHSNLLRSLYCLVLMGTGVGDITLFGGVQEVDTRVMVLLLLFLVIIPILAMNLLIAMMAETYMDVRSEALNRWSLKQAQYVMRRQPLAALWCHTHFPVMEAGYTCKGKFSEFFSQAVDEDPEANLEEATYNEAKKASKLADVAVHGIGGLSEIMSNQLVEILDAQTKTQKALTATIKSNEKMQKQIQDLTDLVSTLKGSQGI